MCAELHRKEGIRARVDSELQSHLIQKPGGAHKRGAAVVKQVAGSIQRAAALDEIGEQQTKEHTHGCATNRQVSQQILRREKSEDEQLHCDSLSSLM